MALFVSCTCCALVSASAECCGYLCSDSCQHEAVTHVIKPCALIPDSVHMCCTLVPEMLCHPSHWLPSAGRSCDSHWDLIACIIGYLNSDLTVFVSDQIKGVHYLWWFVERPQKGCLSTGSSQKATLGSLLQCSFFNNPLLYHNNKLKHGTPIHHCDQRR